MENPEVTIGSQDEEGAVIKIYRLHRLTSHIQKLYKEIYILKRTPKYVLKFTTVFFRKLERENT